MSENQQILIKALPDDRLSEDNYELTVSAMPAPAAGEVLCQTLVLSIDAGTRAGLQGSASYAGAPRSGIVMNGAAIARVVESNASGLSAGDLVSCSAGWQEYSVHAADAVTPIPGHIDIDPAAYLGVLGNSGLTAYFGLLDVGQPKDGETVVISAAAGAVGHVVGQIARIHGCRTIGIAGSDAKCDQLISELGFDGAVNYREDNFRQALREACPGGIDVYFDNTGGRILGTALFNMAERGRIVCCGVVSQYDTATPEPGPRGVPGLLVNQRIRMEGFLVFDYLERYTEAQQQLAQWIQQGDLVPLQDEFEGLQSAPRAFVDLLAGGNVGKRIVRVAR